MDMTHDFGAATARADAAPPARWLSYAEAPRTAFALVRLMWAAPRLALAPRGDGSKVLVIPGFATGDGATAILRTYLMWLGYRSYGWGLGRNVGAKTVGVHNERLLERLDVVSDGGRDAVHVIGWSMGGIMARLMAHEVPERIRQVITLGSPFAGNPYSNIAWQSYERISGHKLSDPAARAQIALSKLAPPVPSTSIYSRSDGVVAWESCLEPDHPHTENIEVGGAHCGLGFCPSVLLTIAERLASPLPPAAT